jgi:DNA-binding NtrC family response regulator
MKLLLVDDDPDFRSLISQTAPSWIEVLACSSTREAVDLLDSPAARSIRFCLIDLCMEPFLEERTDREGLGLVRWMISEGRLHPSILVSGDRRALQASRAPKPPVVGCLTKPLDLDRLYRFLGSFRDLFGDGMDQSERNSDSSLKEKATREEEL